MIYTTKSTQSVHSGSMPDDTTGGVNTPVYTSTAFAYLDRAEKLYPRYFNVPNQRAVVAKLCALECAEAGLLFGSGMAAAATALMALLDTGDHVVFQRDLYGGTHALANHELVRRGITLTYAADNTAQAIAQAITPHTKVVYIETPSNPLLSILDIRAVAATCRDRNIITIIDNTFASPVNQNPFLLGINLVMHSGTKYLGGHSDICCGALVGSQDIIERVAGCAMIFGGALDAQTCYLLERSMKTLDLRVTRQNTNAMFIAKGLEGHPQIRAIYYPGLESFPGHAIAATQMTGFGGMLSFDLQGPDPRRFLQSLRIVRPAMSLGGVESTICQPSATSHAGMTPEQRRAVGITDGLMRLSAGIEDAPELLDDILHALDAAGDTT